MNRDDDFRNITDFLFANNITCEYLSPVEDDSGVKRTKIQYRFASAEKVEEVGLIIPTEKYLAQVVAARHGISTEETRLVVKELLDKDDELTDKIVYTILRLPVESHSGAKKGRRRRFVPGAELKGVPVQFRQDFLPKSE